MEHLTRTHDEELCSTIAKIIGGATLSDELFEEVVKPYTIKIEGGNVDLWSEPTIADAPSIVNHLHEGEFGNCSVCNDITNVFGKDMEMTLFDGRTYLNAGAKFVRKDIKKKRMSAYECESKQAEILATQADNLLDYIYKTYPETKEPNHVITDKMILHALHHLDLQDKFLQGDLMQILEMVLTKHKEKDSGPDGHPLTYILCNINELINPILSFEKTIEGYSYNELCKAIKHQSHNYEPELLLDLSFKFHIDRLVHPLFFCLFFDRIPVIEKMCVITDQLRFLKNLHVGSQGTKPGSDNFEYANARWNTENLPLTFRGISSRIDSEIQRTLCSVMLKKVIFKLRSGNFDSIESNNLVSWLKQILIFTTVDMYDDAEQLISSFMNLFLIKPIQLYVQEGLYAKSPMIGVQKKQYSFIHCESSSQFGIRSGGITQQELTNLKFDSIRDRAFIQLRDPLNNSSIVPSLITTQTLSVRGFLGIFVRRKVAINSRELCGVDDELEYISNANIDIDNTLNVESKSLELKFALCYEVEEGAKLRIGNNRVLACGYKSYVKTKDKWFCYNPSNFITASGIAAMKARYIEQEKEKLQEKAEAYRTEATAVGVTPPEINNAIRDAKLVQPNDADKGSEFDHIFHVGHLPMSLLAVPEDEALNDIRTTSVFIGYTDDYETFSTSNNI